MEATKRDPVTQPSPTRRKVAEHLRRQGVRYTSGRRAVTMALEDAAGPQSAAELHGRLAGAVPLSSLYRTLAVLEEAGVLDRLHGPQGLARYELAEWLAGHHHHLVCVDCGSTEDVELGEVLESKVAEVARELARRTAFDVSGHRLELEGRCRVCRT